MSSVVAVQLGQCGNQLGEAIFDALHSTCVKGNIQDTTPLPNLPLRGPAPPRPGALDALQTRSERQIESFVAAKNRRETFFYANPSLDAEEEIVLEELRRQESMTTRNDQNGPNMKRTRLPDRRVARALLVDMEPRVVDTCLSRRGLWRYDAHRRLTFEGGSGNNWAQGFVRHGPLVAARATEMLRREAEACDSLSGFLLLQSVAGGTGSGVGSRMTEVVRDEFPGATVANVVVWPHKLGEVVVQNYNVALTLAEIQQTSHGIINLFNDEARTVCQRALRVERPELEHLNQVLARNVCASTLIPSQGLDSSQQWRDHDILDYTVREICIRPSLNCLRVTSVPQLGEDVVSFTSSSWAALSKETRAYMDKKFRQPPFATLYTFRGKGSRVAALDAEANFPGLYASVRYEECNSTLQNLDKTIGCLSNTQSIANPIRTALVKANRMFAVNAYMHEYEQAGFERDQFQESLIRVQQLVQDYET
mmetsp:Transcript_12704/g.24651  ORF Transcript_12704/g.24651 Transcript_12704/m.24651 type:complete len:480 (-) Transcript_12704:1010-2449(-)|eukprot:CAMPEP_0171547382 /NCGR_PEP_ID=MMETSP0960-20121227/5174_1 /TAXON_ID=87120 /ORGANISM="Aurantiochytrium limacinum, Strain ATCCMYA-1381" /LENGTH=479 /DNA_ID=CAMNT_0012095593 /DNA_START=288 /DNA_END=1727 /DNA_ORIENTATION=+